MGAIYGGKAISVLVEHYSWQKVGLILACISITLALFTYLCLRSPNQNKQIEQAQFKLTNFKKLLSSPVIWLLAIANLLMVGSLEGFADVWGVPYLMVAYNFSKSHAAELISFLMIIPICAILGACIVWFVGINQKNLLLKNNIKESKE